MSDLLERLFEPIDIGTMRVKNRLVMSPMATNYADEQGAVTPRLMAYYAERAKYDVGMITIECTAVSDTGKTVIYQPGIFNDALIPGWVKLTAALRAHDCRSVLQIHHAGRRASSAINKGKVPGAPSPLQAIGYDMPRELTIYEIEALIEEFADAAVRARKADFDAVELHGAHGYLISQFLSPLSNQRTDRYGGSLENRVRFVREVVGRIKEKAGRDYPVLIKLSVDEYVPGGLTTDDTKVIARILQRGGADGFTASAGHTGAVAEGFAGTVPGASFPRGCNVHLAQALKEAVSVPVGAVGRINDPVLAESILRENKADLIYMGRALMADPELPAKAGQGRLADVRTCIACSICNKTLNTPKPQDTDMRCAINAASGREESFQIVAAKKPKKVMVVGGGPAGMEAARVAALRGHQVSLYEKEKKLGGQLLLASIAPYKDEMPHFLGYLTAQMRKPGISVKLGETVTPDTVRQVSPDVVIIATGSVPGTPAFRGADNVNILTADDVLTGRVRLEDGPVVIIGGDIIGCETAEFLASRGVKELTIIEMLPDIAGSLEKTANLLLKKRLKEYGVTVLTGVKVQEITREDVILEDSRRIKAVTVISSSRRAQRGLVAALKKTAKETYIIGDCVQPRQIIDAVSEGAAIARKI